MNLVKRHKIFVKFWQLQNFYNLFFYPFIVSNWVSLFIDKKGLEKFFARVIQPFERLEIKSSFYIRLYVFEFVGNLISIKIKNFLSSKFKMWFPPSLKLRRTGGADHE